MFHRPRLQLYPFLLFLLAPAILPACPPGGEGPPGGPANGWCVCPGWQQRILQECPSPPRDGNFTLEIYCANNETNGQDLDGNPVCRVNIESSDPQVLTLYPPFIEVRGGRTEIFVFETNANLPNPPASDTVTIFSNYNNVRYDWTTVRVSEFCP